MVMRSDAVALPLRKQGTERRAARTDDSDIHLTQPTYIHLTDNIQSGQKMRTPVWATSDRQRKRPFASSAAQKVPTTEPREASNRTIGGVRVDGSALLMTVFDLFRK